MSRHDVAGRGADRISLQWSVVAFFSCHLDHVFEEGWMKMGQDVRQC